MINIQLTYHGHPIYQICFLNTVMPVALTLTFHKDMEKLTHHIIEDFTQINTISII